MPVMSRSRLVRAVISMTAAAMLLLCQAAFAAYGCDGPTSRNSSNGLCYVLAQDATPLEESLQSPTTCAAPSAACDEQQLRVFSLTDIANVLTTLLLDGHRIVAADASHADTASRAPPLRHLHCLWLN